MEYNHISLKSCDEGNNGERGGVEQLVTNACVEESSSSLDVSMHNNSVLAPSEATSSFEPMASLTSNMIEPSSAPPSSSLLLKEETLSLLPTATATASTTTEMTAKATSPKLEPTVPFLLSPSTSTPKKSTSSSISPSSTTPTSSSKRPYLAMAHEAIQKLSNRSGSSLVAITKYMKSTYPNLLKTHPTTFRNSLNSAIKTAVKNKQFVKVKASYKINSAWTKQERAKRRKRENEKRRLLKERLLKKKKLKLEQERKEKEALAAIEKKKKEEKKKTIQIHFINAAMEQKKKEDGKLKNDVSEKEKLEMERKKLEMERQKEEMELLKKQRAERIKKRKFPMDDIKLIQEDKELNVKRPSGINKSPFLPYALTYVMPHDECSYNSNDGKTDYTITPTKRPKTKKSTSSSIINLCSTIPSSSSRVGSASGMSSGNRGLISDVLQIYHFFVGDVGYSSFEFELKHLMYAVNEIVIGNMKKSRTVPPLISHLFMVVLRILTNRRTSSTTEQSTDMTHRSTRSKAFGTSAPAITPDDSNISYQERNKIHLEVDLSKLYDCLSELSWGEIAFCYIDLMERYYTSDASNDPNALPGHPIIFYDEDDDSTSIDEELIDVKEEQKKETTKVDSTATSTFARKSSFLPDGYNGYLGRQDGALYKAFMKLARVDPWNLAADELIALLRVMTDDVLGMNADLSMDIADRDVELSELLKAKKAAVYHFRKIRIAHQGPKYPNKAKSKKVVLETNNNNNKENGMVNSSDGDTMNDTTKDKGGEEEHQISGLVNSSSNNNSNDGEGDSGEKKKFKPTATKQEFEAAERAKVKAINAYEKGLKTLVARTEPIGYDRNHNAVYVFHHDPDAIYIEANAPSHTVSSSTSTTIQQQREKQHLLGKSWHVIDNKNLFDDFISSLDVRGIRESELYEVMTSTSLRRNLFDDSKRSNMLIAKKREDEEFTRRLENARIACDTEEAGGRRSGRLASSAQDELVRIQEEMKISKITFEAEWKEEPLSYHSLTGLEQLVEFESNSKDKNGGCSKLWNENGEDSEGMVGMIVSQMLSLEDLCNEIVSWEREDISREAWRSAILDVGSAWERGNSYQLGPKVNEMTDNSGVTSPGGFVPRKKLRRSDNSPTNDLGLAHSTPSLSQVLSVVKGPLTDIESRIFTITGLQKAVQEVTDANDNMSVASNSSNDDLKKASMKVERARMAWKKKIFSLNSIPTKRAGAIRDILISAIAIARKGDLSDVVEDLRSALKLHRPGAAGRAKTEAMALLEKYGGYKKGEAKENVESLESENDLSDTESLSDKVESTPLSLTFRCAEAMMLSGSLSGDSHADRMDWKDAVMGCKTVSRFSALAQALDHQANPILLKIIEDQERLMKAIQYWEGGKTRNHKAKRRGKYNSSTEIWTYTTTTERFVMAKVRGYPWWPARVCNAKDLYTASSLKALGRVLVSFVGEHHLHVVTDPDEMQEFSGEIVEEDLSKYAANTVKMLKESMDLARRIDRGLGQDGGENNFAKEEEKKSSS